MQELEILALLKQHNSNGLKELQKSYGPLIRYIISPILSNQSDQEEVFNDVLLRVWDKIDSYDSTRGNLNSWLSTIARNAAIDKAKQNNNIFYNELDETIPAQNDGPESELLRQELKNTLYKALQSLRDEEQVLFYRKYYYRQSTSQIASEFGTTERAIEGKLYRIKQKLRKQLGGELHG